MKGIFSVLIYKHTQSHSHPKKVTNANCGWDLAEWLKRLTANAVVATVLGSIHVESEGRQMKQCRISYIKQQQKFKKEKNIYPRILLIGLSSVLGLLLRGESISINLSYNPFNEI